MTEDWQQEIIARDLNNCICMISSIANILYPEILLAKDREQKLLLIPEMARLKKTVDAKAERLRVELAPT